MHPCKVPARWRDAGARFGTDGLLYMHEWRRGFDPHELRAMFFQVQELAYLRRELERAKSELTVCQARQDEAEARAAWYRRQLCTETRWSAVLCALGG